ncbi:MAG TPA: TetR/AcrR family transcriptional regulator [Aggregatilineales bacterium]|nr:TetR/AcrR family transcriptional regulator [Aggregatilineales bacterium]
MARTLKPEEFASKRQAILDAARRLVFAKGFERMSIQDVLDELHISAGAFHHYFDSRGALLDALIDHMQEEALKPLLPIIHDPHRTAIQKFQSFFTTLDNLRMDQRAFLADLLRVWYADSNAVIRQKVEEAIVRQRAPLLTEIVRQGVGEGVFTTAFPDQVSEILVSMLQSMANTHARLLLAFVQGGDEQRCIEDAVATHAAYMDAVERVLGAPPRSFYRADAAAVKAWITSDVPTGRLAVPAEPAKQRGSGPA